MASADITAKDTLVKGVNSPNNYIRSEAHLLDGSEHPGILAADTHDLFSIPKGNALVGLTLVALDATASEGSATVQFKTKINGAAEALHTAIAKADLAAGDTVEVPVAKIKAYDPDYDTIVQMTVGTAALTALKLLVIARYVPVKEFMELG